MVGNSWDNVSIQFNKIYDKDTVILRHFSRKGTAHMIHLKAFKRTHTHALQFLSVLRYACLSQLHLRKNTHA